MITHKKVTFTLMDMDIKRVIDLVNRLEITKSSIIKDCLLKSFGWFEEELMDNDGKPLSETYSYPKKYPNTKPITVTLPFEVVDRLDYYSKKLGVKKSHLVMCGIEVELGYWVIYT